MSQTWSQMIAFIWSVKEILRDHYKRHQYGEIILPMVVLRRLDSILAAPHPDVRGKTRKQIALEHSSKRAKPYDAHADSIKHATGLEFYNTSSFDFSNLLGDEDAIGENFQDYLIGFSPNVREIIRTFKFQPRVEEMSESGILYQVVGKFAAPQVDLSPARISNHDMGYVYETLIRTVADLSNEEAGEHFTPREVIELMVNLLVAETNDLHRRGKVVTVYDPACGTAGMLTTAEKRLLEISSTLKVHLRGQEIQPESFATAASDMLIKNERTATIKLGDTLTQDKFPGMRFDYVIANPPYGKDWKSIERAVRAEHGSPSGRFGPGLPPTDDGQTLFMLHMLSKLKRPDEGGGRMAVVTNASPLFAEDVPGRTMRGRNGNTNSIRTHLISNDMVEAVIGLPPELFYNTGINTFIWIITNNKPMDRKGFVQLIDARALCERMSKSLGFKRNRFTNSQVNQIAGLYESCIESDESRLIPNESLGYRQIAVNRPLRARYELVQPKIDHLSEELHGRNRPEQEIRAIRAEALANEGWSARTTQEAANLIAKLTSSIKRPTAALLEACWNAVTILDENGDVLVDVKGRRVADPKRREIEDVPLDQEISDYMAKEVLPYASDAYIDDSKQPQIGYRIPFTKVFYKFSAPRPIAAIEADLEQGRMQILQLLGENAHA